MFFKTVSGRLLGQGRDGDISSSEVINAPIDPIRYIGKKAPERRSFCIGLSEQIDIDMFNGQQTKAPEYIFGIFVAGIDLLPLLLIRRLSQVIQGVALACKVDAVDLFSRRTFGLRVVLCEIFFRERGAGGRQLRRCTQIRALGQFAMVCSRSARGLECWSQSAVDPILVIASKD
jgi:hypothetical protein